MPLATGPQRTELFESFERQAGRLPYWLFSALSAALWLIFNELPGVKGAYE
jgi:hypothetical protein